MGRVPDNLKDYFVGFMEASDNEDVADGAWWGMLEDAARWFCEEQGLEYTDCDYVHEYLALKEAGKTENL